MSQQTLMMHEYVQNAERAINRLRGTKVYRGSDALRSKNREEFTMNFDAVSYELSKLNTLLYNGAAEFFNNKDAKFKTAAIFEKTFDWGMEFNECFSTRKYHVDTRLFYSRLTKFKELYAKRYQEWYNTPEKEAEKRRQKRIQNLRQQADKLRFMPRRHLLEAQFGNLKVCRLLKIDDGERLEDHLQDVFGPNWESVVKAALYCNIKDVFVEKTSEVVFHEHVDLEEIN